MQQGDHPLSSALGGRGGGGGGDRRTSREHEAGTAPPPPSLRRAAAANLVAGLQRVSELSKPRTFSLGSKALN